MYGSLRYPACSYLKGHALVQWTGSDFAQLREALTENFPAVRNKKELEVFYALHQNRGKEPSDFIYDLLLIHKKLCLKWGWLSINWLDLNLRCRIIMREIQGSKMNYNSDRRDWYVRRRSSDDHRNRNWRDREVVDQPNGKRDNYRNTYGNGP
ncbi:hypothetical protein TNCV_5132061 [Trichonephila clavipes]|nr:hypothetical protein TNCV_5132061 [Trichonephila clavipes]